MDSLSGERSLPVLRRSRILLRPFRSQDATAVMELFSDSEVTRYWTHGKLHNVSQAEEWIQRTRDGFRERDLLEWAVVVSDEVVGCTCYAEWNQLHRRAKLGFALRRDRWGQGIMTEALQVLLRYGFRTLAMNRIEADVDPRNRYSIRMLERLGFKYEGCMRGRHISEEGPNDELLYSLLASERHCHSADQLRTDGEIIGASREGSW